MPAAVPLNEELAAQTKLALRRLASAVAVVTCRDGERRHAMTATAVNAMSMQPPSMIVCVNRSAAFHAAISCGHELRYQHPPTQPDRDLDGMWR